MIYLFILIKIRHVLPSLIWFLKTVIKFENVVYCNITVVHNSLHAGQFPMLLLSSDVFQRVPNGLDPNQDRQSYSGSKLFVKVISRQVITGKERVKRSAPSILETHKLIL